MSFKNCIGITIQELKLKIEDMSESEDDSSECVSNNHTAVSVQNQNLGEEDQDKKDDDIFFEGAEKLLEIWFTTKNKADNKRDLRSIPRWTLDKYLNRYIYAKQNKQLQIYFCRVELEKMLRLAKCEIISSMTNSEISAYVLSESSLFVSRRRLILKTCGTTTPLDCIERLVGLVAEFTE